MLTVVVMMLPSITLISLSVSLSIPPYHPSITPPFFLVPYFVHRLGLRIRCPPDLRRSLDGRSTDSLLPGGVVLKQAMKSSSYHGR